jgi:hypothetical protein
VVESLTVDVVSLTAPPPAKVTKRMADSIAVVGQHVLVGKSLAELTLNQAAYENVIKEIFERVLVGYSVQAVELTPGTVTGVKVTIEPWGDVVHQVKFDVDFVGLSPEVKTLAASQIPIMSDKLDDTLVGLPTDAVEWASSILKDNLRDMIADKLPEFRPVFDIQPGPITTIKMTLSPIGEVVQDVNVSLRSKTLPNLLLYAAEAPVSEISDSMRGLPISFVQRHKDYFEQRILATVQTLPIAKEYGLVFQPQIQVSGVTEVVLEADTTKYKFLLEGYLDMGRQTDNTSFRLHAGKWVTPVDEFFLETNFVTSTVRWEFVPGYGHQFSKQTEAGFKYSMTDHISRLFMQQDLGARYSLRLERVGFHNELGLRYKIHDFLSAEYVMSKQESYLRLVGNL